MPWEHVWDWAGVKKLAATCKAVVNGRNRAIPGNRSAFCKCGEIKKRQSADVQNCSSNLSWRWHTDLIRLRLYHPFPFLRHHIIMLARGSVQFYRQLIAGAMTSAGPGVNLNCRGLGVNIPVLEVIRCRIEITATVSCGFWLDLALAR